MIRLKILLLGLFTASLLTSCGTSKSAMKNTDDDLYYTQADDKYYVSRSERMAQLNKNSNKYNNTQENSPSSSNSYSDDYYIDDTYNYYDRPYSSRIRRFYGPSSSFGYYDPFFYPTFYGGSRMGWSMSVGYGAPVCYDPFYCNPMFMPAYPSYYYSPFYSPAYYSPYSIYNDGYWRGYREANYYNGGGWNSGGGSIFNNRVNRPRGSGSSINNIYNNRTNSRPTLIKRETSPNYNTNPGYNQNNNQYNYPTRPTQPSQNNNQYNYPTRPSGGSTTPAGRGSSSPSRKVNRPRN